MGWSVVKLSQTSGMAGFEDNEYTQLLSDPMTVAHLQREQPRSPAGGSCDPAKGCFLSVDVRSGRVVSALLISADPGSQNLSLPRTGRRCPLRLDSKHYSLDGRLSCCLRPLTLNTAASGAAGLTVSASRRLLRPLMTDIAQALAWSYWRTAPCH